jgi:hypothetical protein
MNAAPAVKGDYAYVGSRTDGNHLNSGVLVVDVSRPWSPQVVNEIGPPHEGNPGETSRAPHLAAAEPPDGAEPRPFLPSRTRPQVPHEFFLWVDPDDPKRALMYYTNPSGRTRS